MKKFLFLLPLFIFPSVTFAFSNIVITEVSYNPVAPDTAGEWFELYNGTVSDIDISGWEFTDGEGTATVPGGTSIGSGNYFIVAHTAVGGNLRDFPAVDVDLEYSPIDIGSIALSNTADELIIRDNLGAVVDQVSWGGAPRFNISAGDGESIVRNGDANTSTESDWLSNQTPEPDNGSQSTPTPVVAPIASYSKKRSSVRYGCKDKNAYNYNMFSRHRQSKCKYIKQGKKTDLNSNLGKKSCLVYEKNSTILLQSCLQENGFSPVYIDGIFGPLTQKALFDYKNQT